MVTVWKSPPILSSTLSLEIHHMGITRNTIVVCPVMLLLVCYGCDAKAAFVRSACSFKSIKWTL